MSLDARSQAFDSSTTFLETALSLQGGRSVVLGPNWEPRLQKRSIAYKLARLIGAHAMLVCGEPQGVLCRLRAMPELERDEVSLVAAPFVLHDFATERVAEELMATVRERFRNASIVAADYVMADTPEDDAVANMTTDIERDRMAVIGQKTFLREHGVFDLTTLRRLFEARYKRVKALTWSSGRGVVMATNDPAKTETLPLYQIPV